MKHLRVFLMRLWGTLPSRHREQDLREELESHLTLHIDDNLRAGMSPEEARRNALLHLGTIAGTKEAYRDRKSLPFLENRLMELRYALRQMRKNPVFAVTAILMLALGMGGSVGIFAFVDAALLKPLPYQDLGRLVGVYESNPSFPRAALSYLDYLDWKEQGSMLDALDVYAQGGYRLTTPGGTEMVRAVIVSDSFFRTLGVVPFLGRDFQPEEDLPGASRVVMLSYGVWQQRYGGSKEVVGTTLILDREPYTVIGVLPPEFHFTPAEPAHYWTPHVAEGSCAQRRSCHHLYGVGRLKEGISQEAALAELKAIAKRLEEQYPDSNRDQGPALAPLSEVITGDVREILLVLLGGAVLLLLIAATNIANLLLVRSEARAREFTVRNALGASANRLFSQFLTESALFVFIGTALGLALTYGAVKVLPGLVPEDIFARMPYLHHIAPNWRVIGFAGSVALLAGALFALTPVFRLPFGGLREHLAEGGRGSAGLTWRRLGSKLVVLELAMAMVLLVGAGLLSKSLYRLLEVHPGLQPDRLAAMPILGPASGVSGADPQAAALERIALGREVMGRASGLPGVRHAGIAGQMPLTHNANTNWFRIVGRPHSGEHEEAPQRAVNTGYFQTVGVKLLRGRHFTDFDDSSKPRVAIVNQALAKRYFSGEDPVGKSLTDLNSPPTLTEIIGVVEDIKEGPLNAPTPPVIYVPFSQSPRSYFVVFVRTAQDESSVFAELSATVRDIHPKIVTLPATTMRDHIRNSQSVYINRSLAVLVGVFAGLAFLLSMVGLYGVIAYSVSRRNREIGVRMALGARQRSVYGLILREGAVLALIGVAIGLGCALAATGFLRGMLYGIESWDLATFAGVAATVTVAALATCFLPARYAASINPVEALRAE